VGAKKVETLRRKEKEKRQRGFEKKKGVEGGGGREMLEFLK